MTMANPTGVKTVEVNGRSYRLHLGMSVLADLQERFGDAFEEVMTPVEGKLPNLRVVNAIFMAALERYHKDEADRWLVDDIVAQNPNVFADMLTSSFPTPEADDDAEAPPKGNRKKAAA